MRSGAVQRLSRAAFSLRSSADVQRIELTTDSCWQHCTHTTCLSSRACITSRRTCWHWPAPALANISCNQSVYSSKQKRPQKRTRGRLIMCAGFAVAADRPAAVPAIKGGKNGHGKAVVGCSRVEAKCQRISWQWDRSTGKLSRKGQNAVRRQSRTSNKQRTGMKWVHRQECCMCCAAGGVATAHPRSSQLAACASSIVGQPCS